MSEPLLVSLHIPKTAGSTLGRVLAERFGERYQRAYRPPVEGRERTGSDGWPDVERPMCIHGHLVLERFPWVREVPDARFITFLRDPLAGAISMWRYQRRLKPWDSADREEPSETVEAFLINQYNHNRYSKWIARSGRRPEAFFLIGLVERFDESMRVLFNRCGWESIAFGHENRSDGTVAPVDPQVVEQFRTLNEQDYDLCTLASAMLDEHLKNG